MSDGYHTFLGKVDVTAVGEAVEGAVKREKRLTSCDYVHPEYDVYHPEGHPENGRF
jgi:hypothetical protein